MERTSIYENREALTKVDNKKHFDLFKEVLKGAVFPEDFKFIKETAYDHLHFKEYLVEVKGIEVMVKFYFDYDFNTYTDFGTSFYSARKDVEHSKIVPYKMYVGYVKEMESLLRIDKVLVDSLSEHTMDTYGIFVVRPAYVYTLHQLYKANTFSLMRFKYYAEEVLNELKRLEEMKVVHRGLNADRILVYPGNQVVIAHYESAKKVKDVKKVEMRALDHKGSYYLLPPEIATNVSKKCVLDYSKTDLFSIGIAFYKLLCKDYKKKPFKVNDPSKRKTEDYIEMPKGAHFGNPVLKELIKEMCEPNIDKRIDTHAALSKLKLIL